MNEIWFDRHQETEFVYLRREEHRDVTSILAMCREVKPEKRNYLKWNQAPKSARKGK